MLINKYLTSVTPNIDDNNILTTDCIINTNNRSMFKYYKMRFSTARTYQRHARVLMSILIGGIGDAS